MDLSLKGRYPFRLGTTSFIFPADYMTNVRQLAPLVDEIELLLFESRNLPTLEEIRQLKDLAKAHDITYNVHLPMDIDLSGEEAGTRTKAVDAVARAIDRVAPLHPTTHTLHLIYNRSDHLPSTVDRWQTLAMESSAKLLKQSGVQARKISIETLDFDPLWLKPIVERLDLAVCIDMGHVILYGFDLNQVLKSFADRTSILHLHGVANGKDHLALTQLNPSLRKIIANYLHDFTGSASIEVFNLKRLSESLDFFPRIMDQSPT